MHRHLSRRVLPAALVGACMLVLLLSVAMPSLAGETASGFSGVDDVAQFNFQARVLDCDADTISHLVRADGIGDPLDLEAIGFTIDDPHPGGGTTVFSVSDLPGGMYTLERRCPGEEPDGQLIQFRFSRLLVVKQVQGPLPEDPTFVVTVTCLESDESVFQGASVTRSFSDEGTAYVYFHGPAAESSVTCTVEETEDAGAASVVVAPDELTWSWDPDHPTFGYEDQSSTITNTFPEPDPVVEDTVEEAEPAQPVEVEPDFTG